MRDLAFEIVRQAIHELNEDLEYETLRDVHDDTPVFGGDDGIDSLSLVSLVVDLEGEVEAQFGKRIVLTDERAMSMKNSPYRSAGSLADLITAKVGESDG